MSRGSRRKGKRKKGTSTALVVGLVTGGVILVVGVMLAIILTTGGGNSGGPGVPGLIPGASNSRVTPENYAALAGGSSLAEVEAVLGEGRMPTSEDFDAVCGTGESGRYTNAFYKERSGWELFSRDGYIRVWQDGRVRILVFFDKPAQDGGRLIRKVLQDADGSVHSTAGM